VGLLLGFLGEEERCTIVKSVKGKVGCKNDTKFFPTICLMSNIVSQNYENATAFIFPYRNNLHPCEKKGLLTNFPLRHLLNRYVSFNRVHYNFDIAIVLLFTSGI